jgi:flagellar motor component MotA
MRNNNVITVDFATGEVAGQKHMDYIDYVFDNMNKADAREAMKELVSMMLDTREEDREIIEEYDSLLEETYSAFIEAMNLINDMK